MKKLLYISVITAVLVTSCSELPEYELPYEVAPTALQDIPGITVTPTNSLCPGPEVDFTVDSEASIYYIVVPADEEAPTSEEIWSAGSIVSAEDLASGAASVSLDLDNLGDYVVYAITVNQHGIRSEEVTSAEFQTSPFEEVLQSAIGTDYDGSPQAFGANAPQFAVTLDEVEPTSFSVESLWGPNFVAWATGDASYAGLFPYPGTLTINSDMEVTVTSEEDLGGEGTYDPCTGTFDLTLFSELFGDQDSETEEFDPIVVDVVFTKAVVSEE